MRLLVDTDAFCKLGVGCVLEEAISVFGVSLAECARLPALPHMLRRGALRRQYGEGVCDNLIDVAEGMPIAAAASAVWLDKLVAMPDVDPGEAQIFAAAAEAGILAISGDKCALRAVSRVPDFIEALDRRVAPMEALLICLCSDLGMEEIRRRLSALTGVDTVVRVCFSADNADPERALASYHRKLEAEVAPLRLWEPVTRSEP